MVAWNHWEDTAECLSSLLALEGAERNTVLLVDNGSTDGTPAKARQAYPTVRVIENGENLGLARAYNVGLRAALDEGVPFAAILNNDTALDPQCLKHMIAEMEESRDIGVVMPKILYYGARDTVWSVGARERRFPPGIVFEGLGRPDSTEYSHPRDVEYAPSCVLLIRDEVLKTVGLFDEGYFFYYDDWDFCERVRKAGWRIRYVPEAIVYHKVSLSTQKGSKPSRWWRVMGRSSVRFHTRYRSASYFLSHSLWIFARELVMGNPGGAVAFVSGIAEALRHGESRSAVETGA